MSAPERANTVRQEAQHIPGRRVVVVGALSVFVGALAVAVMAWLLEARRHGLSDATAVPIAAPLPESSRVERSRIERTARGRDLQRRERRQIEGFGWVKEGEVARIPIDEAAHWFVEGEKRGGFSWLRPHSDQSLKSAAGEHSQQPMSAAPAASSRDNANETAEAERRAP